MYHLDHRTRCCSESVLAALVYSKVDLCLEWEYFGSCHWPIHQWLMVSYIMVVAFRISNLVGTSHDQEGTNFLLNLRQKGRVPRLLMSLTWGAALPFFACWTVSGTVMLRDIHQHTPDCLPPGTSLWFVGFWQLLSYLWIGVHVALGIVAWVLERRVRSAEGNLRELEDPDVVARWGRVSDLPGYDSLASFGSAGLKPADIAALPSEIHSDPEDETECSICLNDIALGDQIRTTECGHKYHRCCLDLWLLRRGDCPLCKQEVKVFKCGSCRSPSALAAPLAQR